MPETVTEYAVRLEYGQIWPRPSREAAETSIRGVLSRGGTAVLVTRQVTRTDWAEPDETLDKAAWHRAFPALHPWHADGAACYRQGCAGLHEPKETTP